MLRHLFKNMIIDYDSLPEHQQRMTWREYKFPDETSIPYILENGNILIMGRGNDGKPSKEVQEILHRLGAM